MPTIGSSVIESHSRPGFNGYPSKFQHANERAEPGFYSVKLDDTNILAELTSTTRAGFHRYTFPESGRAKVFLDLVWRDKLLESSIKTISSTSIEGYRRSSSWAKNQTVYFVAEFSRPFTHARLSSAQPGEKNFARA